MEENTGVVSTNRGISGSTVKIIAIVAMLIDHIAAVVLERYFSHIGLLETMASGDASQWTAKYGWLYLVYVLMRAVGRMGFPIFAFLLVQGFMHTRSRLKYAVRLGVFALISEIPFNLAIRNDIKDLSYQNVFFTLLIGLLFMCWADFVEKKEINTLIGVLSLTLGGALIGLKATQFFLNAAASYGFESTTFLIVVMTVILGVVYAVGMLISARKLTIERVWNLAVQCVGLFAMVWLAGFLRTDYAGTGVLAIAAMYFFRKNNFHSMLAGVIVLTVLNFFEVFAFLDLIVIKKYNGKKGINMKYIFYAFYPVHLLILHLISRALGFISGGWFGF